MKSQIITMIVTNGSEAMSEPSLSVRLATSETSTMMNDVTRNFVIRAPYGN